MWKREANRTVSGFGIRLQEEEQSKELELECHSEKGLDLFRIHSSHQLPLSPGPMCRHLETVWLLPQSRGGALVLASHAWRPDTHI